MFTAVKIFHYWNIFHEFLYQVKLFKINHVHMSFQTATAQSYRLVNWYNKQFEQINYVLFVEDQTCLTLEIFEFI